MNTRNGKFFLSEDERKYKFEAIDKQVFFPKEVLVMQWYNTDDVELETKLVFRLLNGTLSWCRIRKQRTSDVHADKTNEYISEPSLQDLLGKPFLCKRRSVVGNIYVDKFLVNDGTCVSMIENEGDSDELKAFVKEYNVQGLVDVTSNNAYHSRNMAIPFTKNHMLEVQLILQNYNKE